MKQFTVKFQDENGKPFNIRIEALDLSHAEEKANELGDWTEITSRNYAVSSLELEYVH